MLLASCRAHGIDPYTYLVDVLQLSAPSRKCMNSAGLVMLRFHRFFFFASLVSDGLLLFDSRHFKDLDGI